MTTDTPAAPAAWAEWKAKHMKLVTACEDQAIVAFDAQRVGMGTWTAALAKLDAARAALAAHLDSLPIGDPVAWFDPRDFTRTASARTDKECVPLYRHPKESI